MIPEESMPSPPKSQKLPEASVQLVGATRAPGTFPAEAVPWVPYDPVASPMDDPLIHVHSPVPGLYFQRSLSPAKPLAVPTESYPYPPKSQKFPDVSVQPAARYRAPGALPAAAVPDVP